MTGPELDRGLDRALDRDLAPGQDESTRSEVPRADVADVADIADLRGPSPSPGAGGASTADAAGEPRSRPRAAGVLVPAPETHVVMASRDDSGPGSEVFRGSLEEPVCCYAAPRPAEAHARRATELADRMPEGADVSSQLAQVREEHLAVLALDPKWRPGDAPVHTTYYVAVVPRGRTFAFLPGPGEDLARCRAPRLDGAVHVVMARRDDTVLEDLVETHHSSWDYPVCFYDVLELAEAHASRARALALRMPEGRLLFQRIEQVRAEHPQMFDLDPRLGSGHPGPHSLLRPHPLLVRRLSVARGS